MTETEQSGGEPGGDRVAKVMARAGLCSRREAERWIAEGRVSLNGRILDAPGVTVRPGDQLMVDGTLVPQAERTRLWRYHKPAGLVTTRSDPQGRATVFEKLPESLPRVISVGRLDLNSEGLLLLTNDGELSRRLELPSTGWPRRYRVRVHGAPSPEELAGLAKGVEIEGIKYGPIEALLERTQGSNAWLLVTLREGKNREVRRVMESLGLAVNRLIRVAYGPFQLGLLEPGHVEEVRPNVLRDQVGRWLADHDAGVVQTAAPAPVAPAPAPIRKKPPRPMLRLDAPGPPKRPRRMDEKPGAKAGPKPVAKPASKFAPKLGAAAAAQPAARPAVRPPARPGGAAPEAQAPMAQAPRVGLRAQGPKAAGPKAEGPKAEGPRAEGRNGQAARAPGPKAGGHKPQGPAPQGPAAQRPAGRGAPDRRRKP